MNPSVQHTTERGQVGERAGHSLQAGAAGSSFGNWQVSGGGDAFVSPVDSDDDSCLSIDDNASMNSVTPMLTEAVCVGDMELPTRLSKSTDRSTISFHNITYEVNEKLNDVPCCGEWGKKEILRDVSGRLSAGLNAIMGPTGSGKTSLLDILASRKDPKGLKSGCVLLHGEKPPSNFRLMSGYVVQDDVVMGTLSVRENLAFSANLRVSNDEFSNEQREEKVSRVIRQLGLQDCADTKVGNEFIRGVSGGERKRVNIGMELILDPPIIFLDEPTTGLDANTANSIVLLLYRLAQDGRNIIMSIHQPRYSIFSLFDSLIILRAGRIIYRGPATTAVDHFASIGYECPQFHNPADFFLDIVGGDLETAQLLGRMRTQSGQDAKFLTEKSTQQNGQSPAIQESHSSIDVTPDNDEEGEKLFQGFINSELCRQEENSLQDIYNQYISTQTDTPVISIGSSDDDNDDDVQYPNGFFRQLGYVSGRTVRNIIRNPMTSVAQIFLMIFFGVLMGLLYFQLDYTPSGLQNRAGCFFFLVMMQVMSNLSALELFIKQRTHFIHESASGYYRVSVYFLALVFADLIPNRVIPNIVFSSIVYFMMGFQLDPGKFFFFILTLVITAMAASSLAFLVSASVRVFALANILVAVPYLLMMMFGGFLANTTTMLDWLGWIKWVSIFRYGINALTINEMSGLVFIGNTSAPGYVPNSTNPCISKDPTHPGRIPTCTTGEMYMAAQGIPYGTDWDLWINIVVLAAMAVGFLIFSYIQLRRIEKYK